MSIGPATTDAQTVAPTPPSGETVAAAWDERRLQLLSDLAEAGVEIALALKDRIIETAGADPEPASAGDCADLTRAFDRASRAARMAIALRDRLAKDEPLPGQLARAREREARNDHGRRALRIVRRMDRARSYPSVVYEAMDREARERLFDPDISGEILGRPLGALVAQICKDLDLDPLWHGFAHEPWAQAEIARRPHGSPYAAWPDLPPDAPDPDPDDEDEDWEDEDWDPDEDLENDDEDGAGDEPDDPGGGDP
jgi:hypothetical protein